MHSKFWTATPILVAALILCNMPTAWGGEADYVGNFNCKMCHNKKSDGAQWTVWKGLGHAKALDTLKSDEAKAVAAEKGLTTPPAESPECLKCHVTAYDVDTKSTPTKIKVDDGVQCETCHGPASLHIKDGRVLKTKKDADIDIKAHISHPDEKLCKGCHNDASPTWDPARYTLEDGSKAGFDFKQASKKIAHPFTK